MIVGDPAVGEALLDYLRASDRLKWMKAGSQHWIWHDRGVKATANRPGTPEPAMTSHAFYNNLRTYGKLAGVGDINPHQTRHTFAAWPVKSLGACTRSRNAGHENEATTRHYLQAIAVEPDCYSAAIVKCLRLPARSLDDVEEGGVSDGGSGEGDP